MIIYLLIVVAKKQKYIYSAMTFNSRAEDDGDQKKKNLRMSRLKT